MHYRAFILFFSFLVAHFSFGQRTYSPSSVLAQGTWYKIGIPASAMYKIDISFLNSLGVNTTGISSASIRIYGNGGGMLAESNNGPWFDDLRELAIGVADGGDGLINGSDYIFFYAEGPDKWLKDSINQKFAYQKNLYTEKAYYFLSINGSGKRIIQQPPVNSPNITITHFNERIIHEMDTINFLASGKEWYGEEFANAPGKVLSRDFAFRIPGLLAGSLLEIKSTVVSRSVGNSSSFNISVNNQLLGQVNVLPTGGGVYDAFAKEATAIHFVNATGEEVNLRYTYTPGSFNAQGWLNRFEVFARKSLSINGTGQLFFRDWGSVGQNTGEFVIANAANNTRVWDVTEPGNPIEIPGNFMNGTFRFTNNCSRLREYVAFSSNTLLVPIIEGKVANQNLHNTSPADFIIVTPPEFIVQAERLAEIHRLHHGMRVLVVSTGQIYNEFSSGGADPAAIRDFLKMYHDKYGASPDKLKYVLLFGDASYDYKNRVAGNTNLVPAWQSSQSLEPLSTYVSDDFFGFLDDTENINIATSSGLLDIGIGRTPAKTLAEAKNYVDKVANYLSAQSLGPWRNNIVLVADDEDNNLHLQDAELFSGTVTTASPVFNQNKIYLDAYRQVTTAGGSTFPQANDANNNAIYNGSLVWNYNGHGSFNRLAEENILDQQIVNGFDNSSKLPLFITATCDFAPFDNPQINSLGENLVLRTQHGAIACMTTTRPVFAFSNQVINNNYLQVALQPGGNGQYKSLGEAVMDAKNITYQGTGDIINNRKFTLLGDPALTLAFPRMKVAITKINSMPISSADTLSAMEKVQMEGEVQDQQGGLVTGFNGHLYPIVFDKPQLVNTLANDPGSAAASFSTQKNILFKGKSAVSAGRFSFSFNVPKDINYQYGPGKISLYAENGVVDAAGYNNVMIGGTGGITPPDADGPVIKTYLNDEMFVNGGITQQQPLLILKIADSSGINVIGNGIGHDIIATLDNDNNSFFVLNDFYIADLNSYQQGSVRFRLPLLTPGPHSIKVKAWDVLNNSSETQLDFLVAGDDALEISHVLNYPNPFTTKTSFWFEHNKPGQVLGVQIHIITMSGRVVKKIHEKIVTDGNRSASISWDGRDDYGSRVGRGTYIYRLRVSLAGVKTVEKLEKLVIL